MTSSKSNQVKSLIAVGLFFYEEDKDLHHGTDRQTFTEEGDV